MLHHVTRLAQGRGTPDDIVLRPVGGGLQGERRVAVYTQQTAPDVTGPPLPPFLLVVAVDHEPPTVAPELEVVTADLDPAFLESKQGPADGAGRTVVIYRRTGEPEAATTTWFLRILTGTREGFAAQMSEVLGDPDPDPEARELATGTPLR